MNFCIRFFKVKFVSWNETLNQLTGMLLQDLSLQRSPGSYLKKEHLRCVYIKKKKKKERRKEGRTEERKGGRSRSGK